MKKKDFLKEIAKRSNVSVKTAEEVFNNTIDFIKENLKNGDEVKIKGFGKFYTEEVPEKTRYMALLKKDVVVPAHKKIKFKTFYKIES